MEYRDSAKGFLGQGWSFPVSVDPATGKMRTASSEEDIRQAVQIILATGKGERMMRPDFGCNVRQYLFGLPNYATRTEIAREVQDALIRWEPRIRDVEAEAELSPEGDSLLVRISYVVRSTNNRYNLVYPYYIDEGVEGGLGYGNENP